MVGSEAAWGLQVQGSVRALQCSVTQSKLLPTLSAGPARLGC